MPLRLEDAVLVFGGRKGRWVKIRWLLYTTKHETQNVGGLFDPGNCGGGDYGDNLPVSVLLDMARPALKNGCVAQWR